MDNLRELAATIGAIVAVDPAETDSVEFVSARTGGSAGVSVEVAGVSATSNDAISSTKQNDHVTVASIPIIG